MTMFNLLVHSFSLSDAGSRRQRSGFRQLRSVRVSRSQRSRALFAGSLRLRRQIPGTLCDDDGTRWCGSTAAPRCQH